MRKPSGGVGGIQTSCGGQEGVGGANDDVDAEADGLADVDVDGLADVDVDGLADVDVDGEAEVDDADRPHAATPRIIATPSARTPPTLSISLDFSQFPARNRAAVSP